jgi:hypothetical protein
MGFVMIDTDEYKELVLAQGELSLVKEDVSKLTTELFNISVEKREVEAELNELLLEITKGKNRTDYDDEEFPSYDIASNYVMAEFINANYLENGILKFRKVKKEAEFLNKELNLENNEEKENTNE